MSLVFDTACLVACLILGAGWFDEACRHGATKAKLDRAMAERFPEFDVTSGDRS